MIGQRKDVIMQSTTFKETLLREVETLPEARQAEVLKFIRFLKIGLGDSDDIARRFDLALAKAREAAASRAITDQDIESEIKAVRSGR
jgi:hypothetical protein